jgi:hypothetical protein
VQNCVVATIIIIIIIEVKVCGKHVRFSGFGVGFVFVCVLSCQKEGRGEVKTLRACHTQHPAAGREREEVTACGKMRHTI